MDVFFIIFQIRFVKEDDISLSPNYHRDSCHLTLCINHAAEDDRLRYFVGLFRRFVERGFEPRVHWGKYFDPSGTLVADSLPDLHNFLHYRKQLDPNNIFVNNLLFQLLK